MIELHQQYDIVPNISFVISCITLSGSKPIVFEWTRNGQSLVDSSLVKLENSESSSLLTFASIRPDDSGLYTCTAKNVFGSDSSSTRLFVKGYL